MHSGAIVECIFADFRYIFSDYKSGKINIPALKGSFTDGLHIARNIDFKEVAVQDALLKCKCTVFNGSHRFSFDLCRNEQIKIEFADTSADMDGVTTSLILETVIEFFLLRLILLRLIDIIPVDTAACEGGFRKTVPGIRTAAVQRTV